MSSNRYEGPIVDTHQFISNKNGKECIYIPAGSLQYCSLPKEAHIYTSFPPKHHSIDFKDTNPKSKAATTRLDLSLVPDAGRVFAALAFTEGDAKYGGFNFRELGVKVSTYIGAAERHEVRFNAGEWADPKTGVPHISSILACWIIIADGFLQENINDDRPPTQPELLKFLADAESIVELLYKEFNNEENIRRTELNKGS